MELLTRSILVAVYPLLLLGHLLNRLLGRDPLRLREPREASCWIEHTNASSPTDYFSQGSTKGATAGGGFGWLAVAVLTRMARLFAPPPVGSEGTSIAAEERDQELPDEIYTLW